MDIKRPHLRYKRQTPRERTWTIHFISIEKTVKGIVLLIVAFKLLTLFNRDVHGWAEDFVTRHGIDIANKYVAAGLARLTGMGNTQIVELSVGATIYAILLFIEGIGLWLQKRWAEYLTAIATALFIPVEIYEIYERFTWVRIALLVLNIFVVWYLTTRLKDEKGEAVQHVEYRDTTYDDYQIRVKICGITNLEDALHAVDCGADELGLNFYSKSPRYILPDKAREIVNSLPKDTQTVGIFVNEPIDELLKTAKYVGLYGIQLHGDEDRSYIKELHGRTNLFVIKAFRVSSPLAISDAMDWDIEYPLFDAYSPGERGGTGRTINWEEIAADLYLLFPRSAYLAGGLTPENVAEAVRIVKPYAVDVASGVESSPGKKDRLKVSAFIKAAKEAI